MGIHRVDSMPAQRLGTERTVHSFSGKEKKYQTPEKMLINRLCRLQDNRILRPVIRIKKYLLLWMRCKGKNVCFVILVACCLKPRKRRNIRHMIMKKVEIQTRVCPDQQWFWDQERMRKPKLWVHCMSICQIADTCFCSAYSLARFLNLCL